MQISDTDRRRYKIEFKKLERKARELYDAKKYHEAAIAYKTAIEFEKTHLNRDHVFSELFIVQANCYYYTNKLVVTITTNNMHLEVARSYRKLYVCY